MTMRWLRLLTATSGPTAVLDVLDAEFKQRILRWYPDFTQVLDAKVGDGLPLFD
jgi:hypothetical protein